MAATTNTSVAIVLRNIMTRRVVKKHLIFVIAPVIIKLHQNSVQFESKNRKKRRSDVQRGLVILNQRK